MDAALLTEISSTSETVRWALVNGWPQCVHTGVSWSLDDTICRRLLDGRIDGAVGDVLAEPPCATSRACAESGVSAYLGVTLPTDRARLYVLCCLARERRPDLGADGAQRPARAGGDGARRAAPRAPLPTADQPEPSTA